MIENQIRNQVTGLAPSTLVAANPKNRDTTAFETLMSTLATEARQQTALQLQARIGNFRQNQNHQVEPARENRENRPPKLVPTLPRANRFHPEEHPLDAMERRNRREENLGSEKTTEKNPPRQQNQPADSPATKETTRAKPQRTRLEAKPGTTAEETNRQSNDPAANDPAAGNCASDNCATGKAKQTDTTPVGKPADKAKTPETVDESELEAFEATLAAALAADAAPTKETAHTPDKAAKGEENDGDTGVSDTSGTSGVSGVSDTPGIPGAKLTDGTSPIPASAIPAPPADPEPVGDLAPCLPSQDENTRVQTLDGAALMEDMKQAAKPVLIPGSTGGIGTENSLAALGLFPASASKEETGGSPESDAGAWLNATLERAEANRTTAMAAAGDQTGNNPATANTKLPDGIAGVASPTLNTNVSGSTSQTTPVYAPNLSAQVFDQLQQHLGRLRSLGEGIHQLKLAIKPEAFGPVRVAVNFQADGTVQLQLLGANDAARDSLRQILGDLRRDLASTGLSAQLDLAESAQNFAQFSAAGGGGRGASSGGEEDSQDSRSQGVGAAGTGEETVDTTPRVGDVLKDGTDGGIDMFA